MCYLRQSPSPFIIVDNDHDTDRLYRSQFRIASGVLQFCSVATIAVAILYMHGVSYGPNGGPDHKFGVRYYDTYSIYVHSYIPTDTDI